MTKTIIYVDEGPFMEIRPIPDGDAAFPSYYSPIEVPDEIYAEYDAARSRELLLRNQIVDNYGRSTDNPDFEAQVAAWHARFDEKDEDHPSV